MGGKSRKAKQKKQKNNKHVNLKRKRVKLKTIISRHSLQAKVLAKRKYLSSLENDKPQTPPQEIQKKLHVQSPKNIHIKKIFKFLQNFVICPSQSKLILLINFCKKRRKEKILLFFSSQQSLQFHSEVLSYFGVENTGNDSKTISQIHLLTNTQIIDPLYKFGWVIQYETPQLDISQYLQKIENYISQSASAKALIFLLPTERKFIDGLNQETKEFIFQSHKLLRLGIRLDIFKLIEEQYHFHIWAREAFIGFMSNYSMHDNPIFNEDDLNLKETCQQFGLKVPIKYN